MSPVPVRILVVRNQSVTEADFEAMGVTVDGVPPEEVEFVHLEVAADEEADAVHERVMEALEDESISQVYVIEDEGPVSDWVDDTTIGDWKDLEVSVTTSAGLIVGYFGDDAEDEDDDL